MKIEIAYNNVIVIQNWENELEKHDISQLRYLGFTVGKSEIYKVSGNIHGDLNSVIEYFLENQINFDFSKNIKVLIEEGKEEKEAIQKLFVKAKKIKDGGIDKQELEKFSNFLNKLPRKLRQHQIKAAFHLYSIKNGANFSVPGSGKTSVVLSVYEKYRREQECNVLFVIGPPSSFQPWQHEFSATLGRKPDTVILSGGSKNNRKLEYYKSREVASELYLSTFQTIMNDVEDAIKFLRQKSINVFLVVDEAHYIKQLGGSWANSVLQLSKHAKYRCVLTGTPMPKSYKDVFNIFDFLWNKFPVLTEDDKIKIEVWEKEKENEDVKQLLHEKIGALFYRVRKKDLGLKPAIFHCPINIKMKPNEEKIYELIKSKIYDLSKEDFFENEAILSVLWKGRMMRLRQAVSYPKMLISALEGYKESIIENSELEELIKNYGVNEIPGKLSYLEKKVKELRQNGQKVLIWSNFVGTIQLINRHFRRIGLKSEMIYGKTPRKRSLSVLLKEQKTRDEIRDEFVNVDSGLDILIANPAACAESISLHKTCFNAIYYDLSYNCAQYLQSLDRIHRVGGSENYTANYFFLQYENTIDSDIRINLERKAEKMYQIIEADYQIYDLDLFNEELDDDIEAYKRIFHNK